MRTSIDVAVHFVRWNGVEEEEEEEEEEECATLSSPALIRTRRSLSVLVVPCVHKAATRTSIDVACFARWNGVEGEEEEEEEGCVNLSLRASIRTCHSPSVLVITCIPLVHSPVRLRSLLLGSVLVLAVAHTRPSVLVLVIARRPQPSVLAVTGH